jgi:hypothetical protein
MLLFFVVVLAVTGACTREEERSPGNRAAEAEDELGEEQRVRPGERTTLEPEKPDFTESGTAVPERERNAEDAAGEEGRSPAERAADGQSGTGSEGANAQAEASPPAANTVRRLPKDVSIGALEDRLDGPDEVIEPIEQLFAALADGRVPSELLLPEMQLQLESRVEYMLARASISERTRIGELVEVSPSTYRAPVVAFGTGGGRTTGEIYVANSGGTWYISDILVDLTAIDEDEEQPLFDPGAQSPSLLSF